jgi:cytidylate kinase
MRIGINGVDNSGKSTQIRLLPFFSAEDLEVMNSLSHYVTELSLPPKESFRWWMESDPAEFTRVIAVGVKTRINESRAGICILDRGTFMFRAVCLAKWLLHEQASLATLSEYVSEIFDSCGASEDDFNILLTRDQEYTGRTKILRSFLTGEAKKASPFTEDENRLYGRYQNNLTDAIEQIASESNVISVSAGAPILEVQNAIRGGLNAAIGKTLFANLAVHTNLIVGLSGMSESGKSTMAEKLAVESNGVRLKLNFFNFGQISDCSPEESLAIKLMLFCHTHYFRQNFTVESLHGIRLSAYLKLFFGGRFQLVYLDTPRDIRVRRWQDANAVTWEAAFQAISDRDAEKEILGCSQIEAIADEVVVFKG